MDTSTLTFIVGLAGSIIAILLTIVSFFMKAFIKSVNDLKKIVSEIKTLVVGEKQRIDNLIDNFDKRTIAVDHRLNSHAEKLSKHEKCITILETKSNE